ncbi:hypothetical protein KVR01_001086 [Diaporthe batatas]|uniref:uncharacterized protein n=1 Tax=Diaporthe batatas TaxID=748121 RepID=UPI001D056BDB|nr:uncharacterized protein KVR01_001086 [Diaporthe batatas]KAG8168337.1 hypothetical protein KVR01_001086 [Diaporthe batatas]
MQNVHCSNHQSQVTMFSQVSISGLHTRHAAPKRRATDMRARHTSSPCAPTLVTAPQRVREEAVQQIRLAVSSKNWGNNSLDKAGVQAGDERDAYARMEDRSTTQALEGAENDPYIPPYHADIIG